MDVPITYRQINNVKNYSLCVQCTEARGHGFLLLNQPGTISPSCPQPCSGLKENGTHRPIGSVALLEEVCHWWWALSLRCSSQAQCLSLSSYFKCLDYKWIHPLQTKQKVSHRCACHSWILVHSR